MRALPGVCKLLVVGAALLQGCAWYPPHLDERSATLQAEIDQARAKLSQEAAPYRTGGKDFYVELAGKPIKETLDKFNSLSSGERTLTMSSIGAGGRLYEMWTDCYIIPGRLGLFIAPVPWPRTMGAIVYINKLDYRGWHPAHGPNFVLDGTAGAGYALLYGGAETCFVSFPIAPIGIVLVGGTFGSLGGAKLEVKPGSGIEYKFQLEEPMIFVAFVSIAGLVNFVAPFPLKPELFSGKLGDLIGDEGKVEIIQGAKARAYVIDVRFAQANFINQGLAASGTIAITWK